MNSIKTPEWIKSAQRLIDKLRGKDKNDQKPKEGPYPWEGKEISKVEGDLLVMDWAVTVPLAHMNLNGDNLTYEFRGDSPESRVWPSTPNISKEPIASITWISELQGKFYQASAEWHPAHCRLHTRHVFTKGFQGLLEGWEPKSGHRFDVAITGLNRVGQSGLSVKERSDFMPVYW